MGSTESHTIFDVVGIRTFSNFELFRNKYDVAIYTTIGGHVVSGSPESFRF